MIMKFLCFFKHKFTKSCSSYYYNEAKQKCYLKGKKCERCDKDKYKNLTTVLKEDKYTREQLIERGDNWQSISQILFSVLVLLTFLLIIGE